jgi:hypothetical protein
LESLLTHTKGLFRLDFESTLTVNYIRVLKEAGLFGIYFNCQLHQGLRFSRLGMVGCHSTTLARIPRSLAAMAPEGLVSQDFDEDLFDGHDSY